MKNRIRQLREEKKMYQEDLAKKLNLNISTVSRYEGGQLDISTEALIKMAVIFGCTTDYILGVSDSKTESLPTPDEYSAVIKRAKNSKVSAEKLNKLIGILEDENK